MSSPWVQACSDVMESKVIDLKQPGQKLARLENSFFGEPDRERDSFELDKILKLLRRYKYLLLLFALLGALAGYLVASGETPMYRASNQVVVEPESSNRAEFLSSRLSYYVPRSYYETQQVVISSPLVLEKAATALSPSIIQMIFSPPKTGWVSGYLGDFKDRVRSWLRVLDREGVSREPDNTVNPTAAEQVLPSVEQVARRIRSMLSVSFGQTNQIQRLTVTADDPLVAAVVVNAVADAYLAYLVESRVSQTERAGQWLAEKISESKDKLTAAENELKEYQLRNEVLDLQTVKSLSASALDQVNSDVLEARRSFAELSKRYGPKHPAIIEAKRKLDVAQSRYGSVSRTELNTNEDRFELTKLERSVNSNRELYELFLSRFNEVELGIDSVSSNTSLINRASVPSSPFSPDIRKRSSTGALLGLLLGLIILFGREFLDCTFKNQVDVEERLNLPVLGVLPLLASRKLRKESAVVPERHYMNETGSGFAEVINHIRTGIIYSNFDQPPKVVLVTSALPHEGKTTCSTNLALAFSKLGKTLLIDADFRKPRIAKIAQVENTMGLTGYVAGQNTLKECLFQDPDSEQLLIMRSGEVPPNPLELLSSDRFRQTLDMMRKNFDYIVIDSAPILPVSDGVVLGRMVDAVLMVLKAGATTHQVAEAAIKRFAAANISPTGVVLSQLNYKHSHYYYDKYHYYNKEYYGGGY
ncbi:MAG: polysaccharide biosynthesis tyrosine autokinase [Gammaproteobacteria bacterium]|nr:polysaccharide biosynthesis tyrosine autokinase [Gammaproteobacteria bacterium]